MIGPKESYKNLKQYLKENKMEVSIQFKNLNLNMSKEFDDTKAKLKVLDDSFVTFQNKNSIDM
jgi:hypothetical protein